MSSELRVNVLRGSTANGNITIQGEGTSNLGGATMQLQQGLAKAWFIFDQVNSNTLDDDLNISTITDRDTGSMYGNFTNNMNSVNYTCMAASSPSAAGSMAYNNTNRSTISSADTTARCAMNVFTSNSPSTFNNEQVQQALVHGDLA